jgi:hypothetical protein
MKYGQSGTLKNTKYLEKRLFRSTDPTQLTKFVTLPKLTNSGEQTGIWVFTSFQTAENAQLPLVCFTPFYISNADFIKN